MEYPKAIKELIEAFNGLPSVGKKTAERLALYVFSEMDEEQANIFSEAIISVKKDIHRCPKCNGITMEEGLCEICSDTKRDQSLVMVVENIKDVFVMEKTQEFKGVYHVLGGAINFSSGVGIDDLKIKELIDRVDSKEIKEIILATNATTDGETTARYIKAMLEDKDVLITRIAHGLPFGGDISYADEMTLLKAIEGRRNY